MENKNNVPKDPGFRPSIDIGKADVAKDPKYKSGQVTIIKQGGVKSTSNTESKSGAIEKLNNELGRITSYVDDYYDGKGADVSPSGRVR
jgi:hypothetical protein